MSSILTVALTNRKVWRTRGFRPSTATTQTENFAITPATLMLALHMYTDAPCVYTHALFMLIRLKSLALMSKVSGITVYSSGIHGPTVISETLPKAWAQTRKPRDAHVQTFMSSSNYTVPKFRISYKHTLPWVGAWLIYIYIPFAWLMKQWKLLCMLD